MVDALKHPGGRPRKITPHIARKIFLCFAYGFTDAQVAETFDFSIDTIKDFKKQPEYSTTIKQAKEHADLAVQNALFQRAIGYSHFEEKIFCHEGRIVRAETIKQYPPDTMAAMYWLNNRDQGRWKPRRLDIPDESEDLKRNQGRLVQIFSPIRDEDAKRIAKGEAPIEVLFSAQFRDKMKAKANGNGHRTNGA